MGTPDSDRSAAELVVMAVRRVRQSAISFDWSARADPGARRIGRVDIDFFSNPTGPIGVCHEPSLALSRDKESFGSGLRARWFGL